jgi:hypothetical protein
MEELRMNRIRLRDVQPDKVRRFIVADRGIAGLNERVAQVVRMISSKRLGLLTDYYSASEINHLLGRNHNILDKIATKMEIDRLGDDGRQEVSKIVSYKVDTQNTFLPLLNTLNDTQVVNFVCSSRFHRWAAGTQILQDHQRSVMGLINLLGTYDSLSGSFSERLATLGKRLEEEIEKGKAINNYMADHDILPLDIELKRRAFIDANFAIFIDMARSKNPNTQNLGEVFVERELSYKRYLEMIDGHRISIADAMDSVHNLIQDKNDNLYRDFVDDDRIRKAFPDLKLG